MHVHAFSCNILFSTVITELYFLYQMNAMVSSAIPVLSNAISSIVNNSQNTSFQEICSSVLDTNCLHESETIINRKLRSLVKKELNMVTKTNGESEAKGPEVS